MTHFWRRGICVQAYVNNLSHMSLHFLLNFVNKIKNNQKQLPYPFVILCYLNFKSFISLNVQNRYCCGKEPSSQSSSPTAETKGSCALTR